MEKNFKLTIEYDGTRFHGWQRQRNQRSVQGEIEAALHHMTRRRVVLNGSGRTDAGVHALGQVASFRCDTPLEPETFRKALNSLLPPDVVVVSCEAAAAEFHARYDARGKTYVYRILNRERPAAVGRQYAWHIRARLDLAALSEATALVVGTHDFKAFEAAGSPRSSSVRTVTRAGWEPKSGGYLEFRISADGFLRFMVRNLVGTLVDVGRGRIDAAGFQAVARSRDRSRAGATAPPHGLFLLQVDY